MFRKGERFSEVSPLGRASKEFLGQFLDDANTQVLSAENLSVDQVLVANAVREGNNSVERSRRTLQKHWADPLGVELSKKTVRCWWKIVGASSPKGSWGTTPPDGWPRTPPAWDHASIWSRSGKPEIAVSQPYPWLLNKKMDQLNDFADDYGFVFRISNYPSWHYPGRCWFMEWTNRDNPIHA